MTKIEELENMLNFHVQRLLSQWLRDRKKPLCDSFTATPNLSVLYTDEGYQWEALMPDGSTPRFREKTRNYWDVPSFIEAKKWFDSLKDEERVCVPSHDTPLFPLFKRKSEHFQEASKHGLLNQTDVNEWIKKIINDSENEYVVDKLFVGNGLLLLANKYKNKNVFSWRIPIKTPRSDVHWFFVLEKEVPDDDEEKHSAWQTPSELPSLSEAQEWAKPYLAGDFDMKIQISKNQWKNINFCKKNTSI